MRETVRRAADAGLRIGAHPGYPDLQGFGRRSMGLTPARSRIWSCSKSRRSWAWRAPKVRVAHVKAHGALA